MTYFKTSVAVLATLCATAAVAEGDLSRANVIDVSVMLGTDDDGTMYIRPSITEFTTGQAYRLMLTNVDEIDHEVALNALGERIFTRKVEVIDPDGNMLTEVKGSIREVEVGAGHTVDWYIVPVQDMDASEITCEITGHYEAGMFVEVSVK